MRGILASGTLRAMLARLLRSLVFLAYGLLILLVFGLATRLAALGLLVMTIVVQLTVPSGWPVHLTWAAMAYIVLRLDGAEATVTRVMPPLWLMPVARVQVAPLSVERQTWPSVAAALGLASRLSTQLLPPPVASDHT